ncbi:MAG TPA: phosphatase PAP2 family protein [Azonexus sp.]|nr:phosphatase PAP2 family protein [Azonexus sp.]
MMTDESPANPSPQFLRLVLVCCLLIVLTIGLLVSSDGWHTGFFAAQSVSKLFPPWFWASLTMLGDERMLLALMLPFCVRYPKAFWAVILASLLAALLVRGLKEAIPVQRPGEVLDAATITLIGTHRTGHSFPSSHAASLFAFATVWLAQLGWRRALPICGLAALAGFSRIAVGVHWPNDVLAGALIGVLAAWAGLFLADRLPWGLRPKVHWALVCLGALAVVSLPFDAQGYPDSLVFRFAVCCFGLAGFWRHYLGPLLRQGWTVASRPPEQSVWGSFK